MLIRSFAIILLATLSTLAHAELPKRAGSDSIYGDIIKFILENKSPLNDMAIAILMNENWVDLLEGVDNGLPVKGQEKI